MQYASDTFDAAAKLDRVADLDTTMSKLEEDFGVLRKRVDELRGSKRENT